MRILVDIMHPKQAHFFRPLIAHWQKRGDTVKIVTRDKDITHQLLDSFGLSYTCLSKQQKSIGMAFELVQRWLKMTGWLRRFQPDIAMSVTGISTALPARLFGIPNIALTDTEIATFSNKISFPFADRILTPTWFTEDFGIRHHRYQSFHEWSYLHPSEFTPDPDIVRAEGINPDEPYAIVRFVHWRAIHDHGGVGIGHSDAIKTVQKLSSRMKVYLTSEMPLPAELEPFRAKIRVENMHHIMAFARLVAGESTSMSTEAALLGVPSVISSNLAQFYGSIQMLESKFSLVQFFDKGDDAIQAVLELADNPPPPEKIAAQRAALINELEYIPDVMDYHIRELTGQ